MIKRYPSIAAMRQHYIETVGDSGYESGYGNNSWYNNESRKRTLELSLSGDMRLVPFAEKELDRLDMSIETPRRSWTRGPAGAYCVVPDVLAGLPTPMRHMVSEPDERAPITILVITTSSAGIDAKTLERRGVTILALTMALTRIRPVSLQALSILNGRDNGETVLTAEINTHPLDLSTACYVLTSAGFARRITYQLSTKIGGATGSWPRKFSYDNPTKYYNYLAETLAPDPSRTLVIGAAQLGDELLKNPQAWVERQVKRFTQAEELED